MRALARRVMTPSMIVALKAIDSGARIIATSGLATEHSIARMEEAGVQHFIPKPYTAETLLRTLNDVLHRAPAASRAMAGERADDTFPG